MHDLSRYCTQCTALHRMLLLLPFETGTENHYMRLKRVPTIPVLIGRSEKCPTSCFRRLSPRHIFQNASPHLLSLCRPRGRSIPIWSETPVALVVRRRLVK